MADMHNAHTCRQCQTSFEVTNEDLALYDSISPKFANKKYVIPPPTLCPDCRAQRRYAWRNERTLYRRTCALSGQSTLSVFSPESPFTVLSPDSWYSDKWDPKSYGRVFDFSRSFFDQFRELIEQVPQVALSVVSNQNSDYINQAGWCKNCYLIFEADYNENSLYAHNLSDCRSCMDILQGKNLELCYECVVCRNCYNLRYGLQCDNCSDSWFLRDCIGCSNCIGCTNLRNKKFHIFNEPYDESGYSAKLAELGLQSRGGIERLRTQFDAFALRFPVRAMYGTQNEESSGNYLWNTQRCSGCYECQNMQDCKYVVNSQNMKNVHDTTVFGAHDGAELCYECHEIGQGVVGCAFSDQLWENVSSVFYSKLCMQNSQNLFGCVGLRHANYCILNKQYSKEEYENLVPTIIEHMRGTGEWGEFFPVNTSPFAYNETVAMEHCPLKKEEVNTRGWAWKETIEIPPTADRILSGTQIPDTIVEVPDDILQWAVECAATKRIFRIVKQEMEFCRNQQLPLPIFHSDERHRRRTLLRLPRKLHERNCAKCSKSMQTTYSPDRPEKVYCEECYLKEVY